MECATPRMRFTRPSSVRLTGGSSFTTGTLSVTSPPPCATQTVFKDTRVCLMHRDWCACAWSRPAVKPHGHCKLRITLTSTLQSQDSTR